MPALAVSCAANHALAQAISNVLIPPQTIVGNVQGVPSGASAITFPALAALLNVPTTTTCAASNWLNGLQFGGVWVCAQPAITDLSGLGAGVPATLAIAVGSAGGPVVNGGALGAPSSGNGANLTALNATQLTTGTVPNARLSSTGAPAQIGAVATIKRQSFCAAGCTTTVAGGGSGTYTPSTGLLYAVVETVGSGAGGGAVAGAAANLYSGGGGGSGSYTRSIVTAATIGASKSIVMGAAGAGGAAGSNNGAVGGDVCMTTSTCASGQIVNGKGGSGGLFGSGSQVGGGGAGGVPGTGDLAAAGLPGLPGNYATVTTSFMPAGGGGSSMFGGGAPAPPFTAGSAVAGTNATGYGSGGSGGLAHNTATNVAGGNGSVGIAFITEYCNQ